MIIFSLLVLIVFTKGNFIMERKKLVVMISLIMASMATANAETFISGTNVAATTTEVLDEVIVTANKIAENIQDIPASISVISDIDVEDKGIADITDVVQQIPNLSESNYGYQRAINFRGINQSLFSSTNPVVIYSNGVPQASIFNYDVMLENVERIEVLRGPQSTLYGKDSIGGVINVISKEPDNKWSGNVGLEYGSNNYLQGSFAANGALVDNILFLSVGMVGNKDDGWITNDYDGSNADDSKEFKFNSKLTFTPNDRLTTSLTFGATDQEVNLTSSGYAPSFGVVTRDDIKHANFDMPHFTENNVFSQALNISYAFDGFDFSSLATHKNAQTNGIYDADGIYDAANTRNTNGLYRFQNVEIDEITQEFKLSSNNDNSPLKWVAGVYFDRERQNYDRVGFQYYRMGAFEQDTPSQIDGTTMAVFGQASYDLSDALTLALGGRYQRIDKNIDLTQYNLPVDAGRASSFYTFSESDNASWNAFLPKASLSYSINDNTSVYFSYAKGYLPGGFNYYPIRAGDNLKFQPQTADSYEIGIRGGFLNDKLTLAAAAFYMDIDDIHLYDAGYRNGIYYSTVSNGGKARSVGAEIDATFHINDNWTLNGAFGFTDAKYTEHTNNNNNGNTVRMTPKYTANVSVGYFHPRGFYGRLDVNAQGAMHFDDANLQKQGAWTTADFKVGYLDGDFNIYGYVKNITDNAHIENYRTGQILFNDPRIFGIGIKHSF